MQPESPFAKAINETFSCFNWFITDNRFITANNFLEHARTKLELYEIEDAINAGLEGEYQRQKELRSIEKIEYNQDQLFPIDLLEKLISYVTPEGEQGTVKVRYSTFAHQTQFREKQILDIRKAIRSFDLWEERRELIMPLMESYPDMTFEQVLLSIGQYPDPRDKAT